MSYLRSIWRYCERKTTNIQNCIKYIRKSNSNHITFSITEVLFLVQEIKKPTYQVQLLAFPYLEAKFVVHSMKRSTLRRKIETVSF